MHLAHCSSHTLRVESHVKPPNDQHCLPPPPPKATLARASLVVPRSPLSSPSSIPFKLGAALPPPSTYSAAILFPPCPWTAFSAASLLSRSQQAPRKSSLPSSLLFREKAYRSLNQCTVFEFSAVSNCSPFLVENRENEALQGDRAGWFEGIEHRFAGQVITLTCPQFRARTISKSRSRDRRKRFESWRGSCNCDFFALAVANRDVGAGTHMDPREEEIIADPLSGFLPEPIRTALLVKV